KCNLTILGNGSTVDGGGLDRDFQVFPGFTLAIKDMYVRGGMAEQGGGISNAGNLILVNAFIGAGTSVRSVASGPIAQGGGIYNAATGTLSMDGGQIYGYALGVAGVNGMDGTNAAQGAPESNGPAGTPGTAGHNGGTAQGGCIYNNGGLVTLVNVGLD